MYATIVKSTADAYPVGGSVDWDFRSGTRNSLAAAIANPSGHRESVGSDTASAPKENNIGTVTFKFDTEHMTKASQGVKREVDLLMLALPHHAASISSAEEMLLQSTEFELIYRSIKGRMTPIVGNSWSYEEELTTIGFGDETIAQPTQTTTTTSTDRHQTTSELTAIAALDQSVRDLILETVIADIKLNLPDTANGAYGFGKQVARLAQLAHIADGVETENGATSFNLKNSTRRALASSSSGGQARRAYALLEMYLTMWLTGDDGSGRLVYDANLGGILSKEGIKDVFSDFGNAR
jgi:endoglucanase Acf2